MKIRDKVFFIIIILALAGYSYFIEPNRLELNEIFFLPPSLDNLITRTLTDSKNAASNLSLSAAIDEHNCNALWHNKASFKYNSLVSFIEGASIKLTAADIHLALSKSVPLMNLE